LRILGIDCGTQFTGVGVIETGARTSRLLHAGVIKTNPKASLAARLLTIGQGLRAVIAEFQPEAAAVEDTFTAANSRSALKLTHVRGVALFLLAEAGVEAAEYAPAKVKLTIAGHGRAEKQDVEHMLRLLLGLSEPIRSLDASDAVAVALCHAVHLRIGAAR